MINLKYKVIKKENLTNHDKNIFAKLLSKQGKVEGNLSKKANRCKVICIAYIDDTPVAIGGIKKKTKSDFSEQKSGLMELEKKFDWELGYIFTDKSYTRKGISSKIVSLLLDQTKNDNLMATTEIETNPAMVKILSKNGFLQKGKTWKSTIHKNELGLFLRKKTR